MKKKILMVLGAIVIFMIVGLPIYTVRKQVDEKNNSTAVSPEQKNEADISEKTGPMSSNDLTSVLDSGVFDSESGTETVVEKPLPMKKEDVDSVLDTEGSEKPAPMTGDIKSVLN